jgi:hypothetical protein
VEVRAVGGAGPGRAARRRPGAVALAACLYLVAAIVATAPAISHAWTDFLADGQPSHGEAAPGDHLQTAYRLWLPGHQIEQLAAPWRDPYSFQPEAAPQLNPAAWPFGLPFWPLWRALGIVVGWNVFVLLGLLAGGLATFLWLRELVGTGAALVGGLVFEIAPYRLEQTSTGHLLAPVSLLVPLALWTFERGTRGSRWWLVASVAAIASIPASGQVHLALGAIPFYLAYALVRAPRERWAGVAAVAGTALAVAAGVAVWVFLIRGSIGEGDRSLRQVRFFSASWLDFVVRHERHGAESFVFLGWLAPLVALVGLVLLVRRGSSSLAALLGLGVLVPMVLALGTTTPVYRTVRFAVVPLRHARVPERLMPIACLAIAALVAVAIDALLTGIRARAGSRLVKNERAWLAGAVTAAVVVLGVDLRVKVFEPSRADQGNAAYAALRSEPGRPLELPVFTPGIHYGSVYMYYGTQVPRERPQGYSTVAPAAADRVATELAPVNCGDWTNGAASLIRRLGVRSIVFHAGLFRDNPAAPDTAAFAWRALVQHGYRPRASDGPVTLLAPGGGPASPAPPLGEPPRAAAIFCDGWGPVGGSGQLLIPPHASVWVYNANGADLRLYLTAHPAATVRVRVDGLPRSSREIAGLAETRIALGEEGWHLVTLDAPHGSRVRKLSYAVG